MIVCTPRNDELLRERLINLTRNDTDYWSFKNNSRREHGHGLFQYPAMMVPQVARSVLQQICWIHPEVKRVGDPYAGSGTVLTECMFRGLSFSGTDINPLALLLCRVKAGPFLMGALANKLQQVIARIESDSCTKVEVDFPNLDKWFRRDVQTALSKIRRAILREDSLWARRFFWVGLAEAVRFTSNSRTSTFKLHIRPSDEILARNVDPINIFGKAVKRNINYLKAQANCLKEAGYVSRGQYLMGIDIVLGDSRQVKHSVLNDVILTSPPYGDNATTVPYGQYSFLPLQWINLTDIDPEAKADYLCSTHEIDTRSLGGHKQVEKMDFESLADRSPAFKSCIEKLKDQPSDRTKRVTAFFRDLDASLNPILSTLRPGGLMVWTLGNRKVGGKRVPFDIILAELLAVYDVTLLNQLARRITSKRMALKNSIAETMSKESILVMRKAQ